MRRDGLRDPEHGGVARPSILGEQPGIARRHLGRPRLVEDAHVPIAVRPVADLEETT